MKKREIIFSILFIFIIVLCDLAQEKTEYKIRDNGKDSVYVNLFGKKIKAYYKGQYLKRLGGEKGFYPHGKGILIFENLRMQDTILLGDSINYEGEFFEGKISGNGNLTGFGTVRFQRKVFWYYRGALEDGMPNGQGVLYYDHRINHSGNSDSIYGNFKLGSPSGKVYIKYKNGDVYDGNIIEGKYQGFGIFYFVEESNASISKAKKVFKSAFYEGEWNDNKRQGKGKMCYENGEILDGTWNNDMFTGKGKFTFEGGEVYDGEWVDGIFHGTGKYLLTDSSYYDGFWEYGEKNGRGIYYGKNEDVYWRCNWKNDLPVDTGTVFNSKKDWDWYYVYKGGVGGIKTGSNTTGANHKYVFNGKGDYYSRFRTGGGLVMVFTDSIYTGEYLNGLKHGKGKLLIKELYINYKDPGNNDPNEPDSSLSIINYEYDGGWVSGNKNGRGKESKIESASSSNYEGEWREDNKNGNGEEKIKGIEGEILRRGSFKDNQLEGYGEVETLTYSYEGTGRQNKTIYKGMFKNGSLDGEGTGITEEGTYVGNWNNWKKNGFGKMSYKNGSTYSGEWKDDLQNGQGVFTLANGKVKSGQFINGEFKEPPKIETIKFGLKTWMKSNLAVTKFRNGDNISEAKSVSDFYWASENGTPAYFVKGFYNKYIWNNNLGNFEIIVNPDYEKNKENGLIFYNWYAVNDSRGLAPAGWEIPSKADAVALLNSLGKKCPSADCACEGAINLKKSGFLKAYSKFDYDNNEHYYSEYGGYLNPNGYTLVPGLDNSTIDNSNIPMEEENTFYMWTKEPKLETHYGKQKEAGIYVFKSYFYHNCANPEIITMGKGDGIIVRCIKP
ncbi:MAG: FISUMP domain-containing protein [Bacteroidota bacterium]